jgi:hypothetical protein
MLSGKAGIVFLSLLFGAVVSEAAQLSQVSQVPSNLPWSLNDVTILYPLPSRTETSTDAMISPVDTAYRSKHLELGESLIAALGNTGMTPMLDAFELQQFYRVVGVRLDPCFRDRFNEPCKSQIRFTWQPIVNYAGKWTAIDATLHTFYTLSSRDWRLMMGEWNALRTRYASLTAGQPLQPHPALVKEGLKGAFAHGLRSILSKYATWDRIDRVTRATSSPKAPNSGAPGILWDFAMAVSDGRGGITPARIPNVLSALYGQPNTFEIFGNQSRDGKTFIPVVLSSTGNRPVVSTLQPGVENILSLVTDALDPLGAPSNAPSKANDQRKLASLYQTTLRILQPTIHLPGTTDCVSCHMATSAQSWLSRSLSPEVRTQIEQSVVKTWGLGRYPMTNHFPASTDTRSVRALGYLGNAPAISWRVIFESALVANSLTKRW